MSACFICHAQMVCDHGYLHEYTAPGNIEPFATKSLSNGEVLIAGKGTLSANSPYKAMAIKLSSSGSVIWSIMLGGNVEDRFSGIDLLHDGSYLLYGTTTSFGHTGGKILLVNVSSNGNLIWSKQLGLPGNTIDRIKAIKQSADGDLIGTFNSNDSSTNSNPVVFKIALDGTIQWARRFDNHSATSFTSIGFDNNKIYVGGFYTDRKRKGVITTMKSMDGSVIASQKLYSGDSTIDQEVTDMEVYDNQVSYGLKNSSLNKMLVVKMDLQGNKTYKSVIEDWAGNEASYLKRTEDGFLLLLSMNKWGYNPDVIKFNKFNLIQWSAFQSNLWYDHGQKNYSVDTTSAGGSVSAGYYPDYNNGAINKMIVSRTNAMGETGDCQAGGNTFVMDTATISEQPFSWIQEPPLTVVIAESISLTTTSFTIAQKRICDSIYCKDITPLPPGCNNTSLIEYAANGFSILRDFVNTSDGGKVAVGDIERNGLIVKFKENGDVDWAKNIGTTGGNQLFERVISNDNNIIAFANKYYTLNHIEHSELDIYKLNTDGNILFAKKLKLNASYNLEYAQMSDVFATPDGGFVILVNDGYGTGSLFSYVIRFDSNLQVVWKKELAHSHSFAAPIFRSVFCTKDAVYISNDSYNSYDQDKIGLQKLDYATGKNIWDKRFVFQSTLVRMNKLIVSNDTLYAFINNLVAINPYMSQPGIYLLKVTDSGSSVSAISFEGDPITYLTNRFDYLDEDRPTVAITGQNDFVMSNQVRTTTGTQLNVSRFDKNGTVKWSKNYPGLPTHFVYNIHPDGTGFTIAGTANRNKDPYFTNAFLMKLNGNGEISPNASGTYSPAPAVLNTSAISTTETSSGIDSVINVKSVALADINPISLDVAYDATLDVNKKSDCPPVVLSVRGNKCNEKDTLVYYLADNRCGAVATWKYDTTFFKLISSKADSMRLVPQKTGESFVYATIADGCSIQTDSILASVSLKASSLNLGSDTTICSGSTITLHAGAAYSSYLWNNSSTDSTITVSSAGIYFVKVADKCGEEAIDSIRVTFIENNFHITGAPEKCNNDTVILSANGGYANYQWAPSGNLISDGSTVKVSPLKSTWYYATAETLQGCFLKDSFLLTVNTSPSLNLGNDTSICEDKSIILTASTGFANYDWSEGSTSSSIEVTSPGLYFLSATYSNNCISRDTIQVNKYPFIKPFLGNDTSICEGTVIHLLPDNYKTYEWSNGVITDNSITVYNKGVYWVKVTDQNSCIASDTINILNVYNKPENFLPYQMEICYGDGVILQPTKQFMNYEWSTGEAGSFISVKDFGAFQLTVTDQNGCIGKDTIIVSEKPSCSGQIYFFNAFTPNGDGINEQFKPVIRSLLQKYSLKVYNRFGEVVFSTNDQRIGWDGTFKGAFQPAGIYVWYCNYQFNNMPLKTEKGTVTLIR
jgi:gliding motility-associated-like protein